MEPQINRNWQPFVNESDGCYLIVKVPADAYCLTVCDVKELPNQTLVFLLKSGGCDFVDLAPGKYELFRLFHGISNEGTLARMMDKSGDRFRNYTNQTECPTARESYKSLLDFLQMPYHATILKYLGER